MSVKSRKVTKMRRKSASFHKRKHTRQTRKRSQSRRRRVRFNLKGGCGCEMTGGQKQRGGGLSNFMIQDAMNLGRVGVHNVTTTMNGLSGVSNVHNPNPLPWAQGPLQV
jgi:hypothetical protein